MPSFLYAMPMEGGRRVFLEETCLVAKPALPFAVLKRRLQRRLAASGIKARRVPAMHWPAVAGCSSAVSNVQLTGIFASDDPLISSGTRTAHRLNCFIDRHGRAGLCTCRATVGARR